MGKKLGNNYRLFIGDGGGTEVFTEIKGQQNLSISRSGATIDTSTKDNAPYGTSAPGLRSLSLALALIPDLPDPSGYTALETFGNAVSPTPKNFQIKVGAAVVFACSMYLPTWNSTFDMNDAVKATGTLIAAAAPTIDALS